MLQKVETGADYFEQQPDRGYLLRPSFYWELFKRRVLYFLIPFVVILAVGVTITLVWPATYYASGKILVTTQQIPTDLVRPTVTTLATERIQVIGQRVITRDNLAAIAAKYNLFPDRRSLMSTTEVTDVVRKNITIAPISVGSPRASTGEVTIAFTIGFYYENARVAAQVANELMTRVLNEDLRDRTGRAVDTTRFLTREFQRLNEEYAAVEARIAQVKRSQLTSTPSIDKTPSSLAQLRAEYLQKSQVLTEKHPTLQALKRQLDAFEKANEQSTSVQGQAAAPAGLDTLEAQQTALQKNLEETSRKLAAARLGETLERDQQSEKFEVIEQPTEPQKAFKPDRFKMLGASVAIALMAGLGLAFAREILDRSIRRASDLAAITGADLVISIPYIRTEAEQKRARLKAIGLASLTVVILIAIVAAAFLFLPPIEMMIAQLRLMLTR